MDSPGKFVLLVEDDPPVRQYVRTILNREGFVVLEAADGLEGFQMLERMGCRMGLVVTDIKMPRMDGITLAHKVRERCPELPVLLISGLAYPFGKSTAEYALLRKPFMPSDLREAVHSLIAA